MVPEFRVGDMIVVTRDFNYDGLLFTEGMLAEIRVLDEMRGSHRYGTHWLIDDETRDLNYGQMHTLNYVDYITDESVYASPSRKGWWIPWYKVHEYARLFNAGSPDWEV